MTTTLLTLIQQLQPLLSDVSKHWKRIVALLREHRSLAEYEVARHLVASKVSPVVNAGLKSQDARERLGSLSLMTVCYGRSDASRHLRRLVKDSDPRIRRCARAAINELLLADVALPDTRFRPPRSHVQPRGGWNPTGWVYGIQDRAAPQRDSTAKSTPDAVVQAQLSLPRLANRNDVLHLLGIQNSKDLRRLMRPGLGTSSPYIEFEIPKATGGVRVISAPRKTLKLVQRNILRKILDLVPAHDAAHGFVKGRSIVSNAAPHAHAHVVVKMDLQDFFPSIHHRRVVGLFELLGYNHEVSTTLAGLTTHASVAADGVVLWPGALPQGAPTSPAMANLICRRLDARLSGLADTFSAEYTRYADDLTFSFRSEPEAMGRFLWWVDQVCQQEGFTENTSKRRVLRASMQQRVAGVVVNTGLWVPRAAKRQFRAILSNCRKHGIESQARGREHFRAYLLGYASYVKMVQPELGKTLLDEVKQLLRSQPATATRLI